MDFHGPEVGGGVGGWGVCYCWARVSYKVFHLSYGCKFKEKRFPGPPTAFASPFVHSQQGGACWDDCHNGLPFPRRMQTPAASGPPHRLHLPPAARPQASDAPGTPAAPRTRRRRPIFSRAPTLRLTPTRQRLLDAVRALSDRCRVRLGKGQSSSPEKPGARERVEPGRATAGGLRRGPATAAASLLPCAVP